MPYPKHSADELERLREADFRAVFGESLEDFVERQFRERSGTIARRFREQSQEIARLKDQAESLRSNLQRALKAARRNQRLMPPETAAVLLQMAKAVEHDVDPVALEPVIDWLRLVSAE